MATSERALCTSRLYSASSIGQNHGSHRSPLPNPILRRAVGTGRAKVIHRNGGKADEKAVKKTREKAAGNPFFHRLRPPGEFHRNQMISGTQTKGGETRQDLKIPGVSPWWLPRALSCSYPAVYRCLSAVMAAFSHTTPDTRFRLGSSLQAGLYARTPRSVRLLRLIR